MSNVVNNRKFAVGVFIIAFFNTAMICALFYFGTNETSSGIGISTFGVVVIFFCSLTLSSILGAAAVSFVRTSMNGTIDTKARSQENESQLVLKKAVHSEPERDTFLRGLLDDLQDEVYIYNVEDRTLRYANFRAQERCAWSPDEIGTKKIYDSDPNFSKSRFDDYVQPLLSGDADSVTIETVQQKGPVEIVTRLYDDMDGKRMFVSVLRDITKRAALEEARMRSMSVVSHELKTPLTSIKGALRLLQADVLGRLSDEAKPIVDIATRNSDRLLLLVNDILDHEKMRAGQVKLDLKRANLIDFLNDAVATNKGYADEHAVKLKFDTDEDEAWADIDKHRLMQVMSNLISNAVKFSPRNDTVSIWLKHEAGRFRIHVKDNGPGIPEKLHRFLFDSFTQLESPDGKRREGAGLGLAISKTIIKSHGGWIDFQSSLGAGATFFVDLLPTKEDTSLGD